MRMDEGNVIYETTNNVHASVLNRILYGTFVCMCLFFWFLAFVSIYGIVLFINQHTKKKLISG